MRFSAILILMVTVERCFSQAIVSNVAVRTRATSNPAPKVWYRVPEGYRATKGRTWRTLVIFGGRNCEGPRDRPARHLEVVSQPSARRAAEVRVAIRNMRRIRMPLHEPSGNGSFAAGILYLAARCHCRAVIIPDVLLFIFRFRHLWWSAWSLPII